MRERRETPRVPANDEGLIAVEGGPPVACRLADRSAGGVWLWVPTSGIPDRFRVELPATGEVLDLTVVWRRPSEIGARVAIAPVDLPQAA